MQQAEVTLVQLWGRLLAWPWAHWGLQPAVEAQAAAQAPQEGQEQLITNYSVISEAQVASNPQLIQAKVFVHASPQFEEQQANFLDLTLLMSELIFRKFSKKVRK